MEEDILSSGELLRQPPVSTDETEHVFGTEQFLRQLLKRAEIKKNLTEIMFWSIPLNYYRHALKGTVA
jgi:hypothetical protein